MRHPLERDFDEFLGRTPELWTELRGGHIFITGATGFFGCWVLETFAWANRQLGLRASATILSRDPERLRKRLPHLADGAIRAIEGDIRDFRFPDGEFTHVIHAATESSAALNTQQPQLMFDTIVEGTRHCLDFALHRGVRKFLLTSSGAVYGKQPPHLMHVPEDYGGGPDPLASDSAYAEGKRAAELLTVLAAQRSKLEAKIARCFAFVGPYMKLDTHFAIGNFIRDGLEHSPIVVQGDGTPVRSYMYASDLMVWLWTILFRGESCRAYNVGSEDGISIGALAQEVASVGNSREPVQIMKTPIAGAPVARYVPSTARARQELGLACTVPLRNSIERTMNWARTQRTPQSAATVEVAG
jgi:dTDP-glucose 4,6-dehydratase